MLKVFNTRCASDDTAAQAALAWVITAAGLSTIDAGALSRGRGLEAIGFLHITMAAAKTISGPAGFAVTS